MCGIAVAIGSTPPCSEAVERARERLAHRGPDGRGIQALGGAVLGHRRLSIIDVAGGAQPILNERGGLALACNGEIYNHEALRRELRERHSFRSRTDSEVILHLYEEVGPRCVERLDGMFAFVITDGARFLAARDPLGIKPLYLGRDAEGAIWFSSELKALADRCPRLEEFPPGTLLTEDGVFRRWFAPRWTEPPEGPPDFDPEALRARAEAAVEKRLMSDVPLGVFLSGGLDSSLIAALVKRRIHELHSFSVGLAGSADLAAARRVAEHLGTIHHEHVYDPAEVVAVLPQVIAHLESYDPALVRSAIPCYFVSRLAAERVKVVLSGEGSDEAFAGYLYFGESTDPEALHAESVRLLMGLHNMNLQRVDRMTMAHGLEGRVPFLDVELLDLAMGLDPAEKRHRAGRPEKWLLRTAFEGSLPAEVLWRTKQEFAQGAGSEWTVRDHAERVVSDGELARAATIFPEDTPRTKEEILYRRLFDETYPGEAARRTVGRWRGAFERREEVESHV